MGWFDRFRSGAQAVADELAPLDALLENFFAAALAAVDRAALERSRERQKLTIAFQFGALEALAAERDLDETQSLVLASRFLNRHFPDAGALGGVTALQHEFAQDIESRAWGREGGEAFRRWRKDGAGAQRLAELLRHI